MITFGKKRVVRNTKSTPKKVILDQMGEPRPLPMGRTQFEEWSDRIISGALVAGVKPPSELIDNVSIVGTEYDAFIKAQKNALANMLMHLGPTESHKPDAFFIHALRVGAVKQTAWAISTELTKEAKKRTAEAERRETQSVPAMVNQDEVSEKD